MRKSLTGRRKIVRDSTQNFSKNVPTTLYLFDNVDEVRWQRLNDVHEADGKHSFMLITTTNEPLISGLSQQLYHRTRLATKFNKWLHTTHKCHIKTTRYTRVNCSFTLNDSSSCCCAS